MLRTALILALIATVAAGSELVFRGTDGSSCTFAKSGASVTSSCDFSALGTSTSSLLQRVESLESKIDRILGCEDGMYANDAFTHLSNRCQKCHAKCHHCTGPADSQCTKCEGSKFLHGGKCVAKCTCSNGAPHTGRKCAQNAGTEQCASCNKGYHIEGSKCEPDCDKTLVPRVTREDRSGCNSSGAPSSCQNTHGWFCCHRHSYKSGHKPTDDTDVEYTFSSVAGLERIDVSQHGNGVNCIRAFWDGKDAGEICPWGHRRGGGQYGERSGGSFDGFNRSVRGTHLRLKITDTSLSNGWAMYKINPIVFNGCPGN